MDLSDFLLHDKPAAVTTEKWRGKSNASSYHSSTDLLISPPSSPPPPPPPSMRNKHFLPRSSDSHSMPAFSSRSLLESSDSLSAAELQEEEEKLRRKLKRDEEFKKKQQEATKRKKELEKKIANERQNAGFGDLSSWLKSSGSSMVAHGSNVHFPSLNGTKRDSSSVAEQSPVGSKKRPLSMSTQSATSIAEQISPFNALDDGDFWVTCNSTIYKSSAKFREAFESIAKPKRFGCANQKDCSFDGHSHEQDETVLGKLWFGSRLASSQKSPKEFACLVLVDPFNTTNFPLSNHLKNAHHETKEKNTSVSSTLQQRHYTDTHQLMIGAQNYPGSIFRLRQSYQTELANLFATCEDACDAIRKRFSEREEAAKALGYTEVLKEQQRDINAELDRRNRVFHTARHLLDEEFRSHVAEALTKARNIRFPLPPTTTIKACLEIIKLKGGHDRTDRFYIELLKDVAKGDTSNLQLEKDRLSTLTSDTSLDRFSPQFRSKSTYDVGGHSGKSSNDNSNDKKDDYETGVNFARRTINSEQDKKRRKVDKTATEEGGGNDSLNSLVDASSSFVDKIDNEEREKLLQKLSFLNDEANKDEAEVDQHEPATKDDNDDNSDTEQQQQQQQPSPDTGGKRKTEINYICSSQYAIDDAQYACTSIAFCMALRLVNFHRQKLPIDLPSITQYIWEGVAWQKVIENGALVWRNWRSTRKSDESTFMLPTEILPASDYFKKKVADLKLELEEFGGPLHGKSLISHDQTAADSDTPTFDAAIAIVHSKRKSGVFAAVFTFGASSICIGYQDSYFYLIDSHGVDKADKTSMVRFPSAKLLIAGVRRTYPSRRIRTDDIVGNAYSMLAMYPPE